MICSFLVCQAQSPDYINYSVEDGLPSNETYQVFEDSKGFIWIGTDRGVSRFNGYKFENFTTSDGLPDNTVFGFVEDKKGRIWFRTFNGKLGYYSQGKFELINSVNFGRIMGAMAIDNNDRFYIATSSEKHIFSIDENLDTIQSRVFKRAWIMDSVFCQELLENTIFNSGPNYCTKKSEYAFISWGITVYITDNEFHILKTTRLDATPSYVEVKDSLAVYYFHDKSIAQYSLPSFTRIKDRATNCVVSAKLTDKQGNHWVSSLDQGVFFYANPECLIYQKNSIIDRVGKFGNSLVYSTFDTDVYFNFRKRYRTNNRIREFREYQGYLYQISSSSITKTNSSGMKKIRPGRAHSFCISGNSMWLSFGEELTRKTITPQGWLEDTTYFKKYRVEKMEIRGNDLWLATINGLAHFNIQQEKFRYYDEHPLLNNRITDIAISNTQPDLIFLASRGNGLLIKQDTNVFQISKEQGLLSDLANSVYNEADSILWVATNNGLSKVSIEQLDPVQYSIQNFTKADGLSSNNINDVFIMKDSVYLATNMGLSCFSKYMRKRNFAPPTYITGVQINNQDTTLLSFFDLHADQNTIKIEFLGLSYADVENLKYKYRLIGNDTTWQLQSETSVQYLSLPPNSYKFEVAAVNHNGLESLQPATLSFIIRPPFYNRWWFIIGVIAVLTFITHAIINRRLRLSKESEIAKRQLVEMELKALRSQMNPHFTFNTLNSIQSFVNTQHTEEAVDYIAKFAELMRLILENSSREFVEIHQELKALKRYLEIEQLRFEEKFEYTIEVDENINVETEKIPSMILQPYIENAIWHGLLHKPSKGKISVSIKRYDQGLLCIVDDNGIGREKALEIKTKNGASRKSFGMLITGERLEILNKLQNRVMEVSVIDKKDDAGYALGTRVELRITNS